MKVFVTIVLSMLFYAMTGQTASALSQSEILTSFELEYLPPVEVETASIGAGKLGLYSYQMGVEVDNGSSIVLLAFDPDYESMSPSVHMTAKVSSLATNDQDTEIKMVSPSSSEGELLNADWASRAYFIPKKGTGRYDHGKLTAIYREGVGLIYIYYLSRGGEFSSGELFQFMDLE